MLARKSPPVRRSWFRRILRALFWLVLLWLVGTVGLVLLLRVVPPPTSAFMIERWISEHAHGERGIGVDYRWVPWNRVSPELPIALVASEDQKFPTHHGFDVQAIESALAEAEDGDRLRGASTISQQTAKNLFLWGGRSFVRKGLEAYFTVLLETLWPKRRILEVYLNVAEFGDGIYGAGAASARFFRTTPDRLTAQQSALLASVLPNPRRLHADRPSPYVMRRVDWIERQARQLGGPAYLPR